MAPRLPRPLHRRELLYGTDTPPETLSALGEAYMKEGLVFDAGEFFGQAKDREGLEHVRQIAIEMGDAWLLRRVKEAMPEIIQKSDWDRLARAAKSLGKEVYAERAEAGGAPPAPPLQEELAQDEEAVAGEPETGPDGGTPETSPGQSAKGNRKREVQGG